MDVFTGFEKIIEERIRDAARKGEFDNLENAGKPLNLEDNTHIPEDLRIAYKILKNADCLPPELQLKKDIRKTEELLEQMEDTKEKYKILKKLNFLILKLNQMRSGNVEFDMPQKYQARLADIMGKRKKKSK